MLSEYKRLLESKNATVGTINQDKEPHMLPPSREFDLSLEKAGKERLSITGMLLAEIEH